MKWLGRSWLWLVMAFLYLPVVVMMAMAFNASPYYTLPVSLTTRWFLALAGNDRLLTASSNSLVVALTTAVLATALGAVSAIALDRRVVRGRSLLESLLLPPLAVPWLIIGTAMLVFFSAAGIGRGLHAMLIGHVALAIPYVILVVGSGLKALPRELEDAALCLGATPPRAFFSVTLPLLLPSLIAAALFAFAVSLDQFVVSYFLATPGFVTLPVEIYASIRKGFTPEINAVSTLLIFLSMLTALGSAWLSKLGASR